MFNQLSKNGKSSDNQVKVQGLSDEQLKQFIVDEHTHPEIEQVMDELKKLTETNDVLNRRVKLSINKEINRIIITVVDKNTDEVIRKFHAKNCRIWLLNCRKQWDFIRSQCLTIIFDLIKKVLLIMYGSYS